MWISLRFIAASLCSTLFHWTSKVHVLHHMFAHTFLHINSFVMGMNLFGDDTNNLKCEFAQLESAQAY